MRTLLLLLVVVVGVGLLAFVRLTKTPLSSSVSSMPTAPLSPSATPFPFQELTIPYLRSKMYESQLSQLRQIEETSTYTSYLTSYTSDGLRIQGLLTIPKGDQQRWPAIVFVHGYIPPTQYRTQEKYTAYVDYLARNGFVVFKIDLRGHGESEGEPGGAYYSSDYVIDTLNAYAALTSTDFVDPQAVGLWGHSMAGNVVLRSMAVNPTIPAGVVWAGAGFTYEDLRKYGLQDNSYRPPSADSERQQRRRELFAAYGQYDPNHWYWQQVSPVNYLPELQGALQLHHAVDDSVVNVNYSRDLDVRLDSTQVVHEVFEYQHGGHNIENPSFTTAMQRSVEFFQQQLAD